MLLSFALGHFSSFDGITRPHNFSIKNILTERFWCAAEITHSVCALTLCSCTPKCNTGDGQPGLIGYKAALCVTVSRHGVTDTRVSCRAGSHKSTRTPRLVGVVCPRPLTGVDSVVAGEVGEGGAEVVDEGQTLTHMLQFLHESCMTTCT